MTSIKKYSSMVYFFSCYLNQDFEEIFGSADEALSAYIHTESREEYLKLKSEIESLIALSLTEESLQNLLLNEIGCEYYYLSEWASSETWLKHIVNFSG